MEGLVQGVCITEGLVSWRDLYNEGACIMEGLV